MKTLKIYFMWGEQIDCCHARMTRPYYSKNFWESKKNMENSKSMFPQSILCHKLNTVLNFSAS